MAGDALSEVGGRASQTIGCAGLTVSQVVGSGIDHVVAS